MIDVLSSNEYGINFDLNKNISMLSSDMIPDLKHNKTWTGLLLPLVRTTMKGVGIGEMFFTFVHPKARFDSSKDLLISDKSIECKKFDGACIKGNEDSGFRIIDDLCDEYRLRTTTGKSQKVATYYNNIIDLNPESKVKFWKRLYPNMNSKKIKKLVNMEEVENASFVHGMVVLDEYKSIDDFNSLLLVSEENNPRIIHLANFQDYSFIKDNIRFTPKFRRGGDTNALADGYVVIEGVK